MNEKLETGYKITTKLDSNVTVIKHLGEGGQGDVYAVDYNGEQKALKWYKKTGLGKNPQAFYELIESNVSKGAFNDAFLWPIDITNWTDGTFGYVMDLRPEGFFEVSDFMLRKVAFPSFKIVVDSALNIVTAFRLLHNAGYCYQDLNDGNFFINPKNGKVLICDNDNVAPPGTETGILGKPGYMAPEVVLQNSNPTPQSDRFSLSVILFILICSNHPLEGKRALSSCLTPALQEKLYGSEALFIMDKDNRDNAPDPYVHKNVLAIWDYMPTYIKDIFLNAFSQEALNNASKRPSEVDWIKALVRFRSDITPCDCSGENFADNGVIGECDTCGKQPSSPMLLKLPEYNIPIIKGSRIYRCQISVSDADEALNPMGNIVSKAESSVLGIKNLSESVWSVVTPSGNIKKVAKGEVVPAKEGLKIKMSPNADEIVITSEK